MEEQKKEEKLEEKLEFFKKEEIKTMAKDIAYLREMEAQKEREKIAKIGLEREEKHKEEMIKKKIETPQLPEISKRKISLVKKVAIRGGFLIFFFFILGFFILNVFLKKPPEKPPETPELPEEILPLPEEEKPKIPIPSSLFRVEKTKVFEISEIEDVSVLYEEVEKEEIKEGEFLRIVIKDITKNQILPLGDLAKAFQIEIPSEFYQKLDTDYTLAVFSQKEGKRIVFAGKVKEGEDLLEILKSWEKEIEKEGLLISGEKIQTLTSYFKTALWQDVGFRFLTISKEDLGVCYAWFDGYFVVTSSFESMKETIDRIKLKELEGQIGQLFIVGFEGKNITPEFENFFKKYKPGGVLLLSQNIENSEQLKTLTKNLQDLSLKETGVPLFIAVDQEGGLISRIDFLEEKTPQSEIENSEIAYQVGFKRGQELKELGININLAPLLDAMTENDFYYERTFQKPPAVSGELAKDLILGQKAARILTCLKHFPGYVGIDFDPEERLAEIEKIPEISQFKKALEAAPEMVMISNVIYREIDPSLPFSFSSKGVQFLRENLGSEVLILSDDLSQDSLLEKFPLKEIVKKPITAGVNIMIVSGFRKPVNEFLDAFLLAFESGEINQTKVKESVTKILQFKEQFLE